MRKESLVEEVRVGGCESLPTTAVAVPGNPLMDELQERDRDGLVIKILLALHRRVAAQGTRHALNRLREGEIAKVDVSDPHMISVSEFALRQTAVLQRRN